MSARELLRVPCDLDLADAGDREEAEQLYADQARVFRDALVGADVVLDVWREPLCDLVGAEVMVDYSVELPFRLPAPRLMPTALIASKTSTQCRLACSIRVNRHAFSKAMLA